MSTSRKYTHYKGLKAYLDVVSKNSRLDTLFSSVVNSTNMVNEIDYKMNEIKIDKTWVNKIKEYLPYVSLCISEDRKFMRNLGEDVKIEKVKKVGRESFTDLAKNSKKIEKFDPYDVTKIQPKEILVTQKLDDYGIYENKFLYLLIVTIKSFIDMRFSKIEHARNQVIITTKLKNKTSNSDGEFSYEFNINDVRFAKADIDENDENIKILSEILSIKTEINKFLNTNLIQEVSKLGLIKPPINHTNVLKNDVNFIKALELFEFLMGYEGDGFEIKEINQKFDKVSERYIKLFGYLPLLVSSLSYLEVKNLFASLEKKYLEEMDEEKANLEQFILDSIMSSELTLVKVKEYITHVNIEINDLRNELKYQEESFKKEIEALNKEMRLMEAKHEEELFKKENEIKLINEEHEKNVNELKLSFNNEKEELNKKINDLNLLYKGVKDENTELAAFIRANNILSDVSFEKGIAGEEYFNKLEEEKRAFDAFFDKKYKESVKVVKKETEANIRNDVKNNSLIKKAKALLNKTKENKEDKEDVK